MTGFCHRWLRDLFGDRAKGKEEREILREIGFLRDRRAALDAAAGGGAGVAEARARIDGEVEALQARLPRGDRPGFFALCLGCAAIGFLLTLFYADSPAVLQNFWGPIDRWGGIDYIQRYRPYSSRAWLLGHSLASTGALQAGFALLLAVLWRPAATLPRRRARAIIRAGVALLLAIAFFLLLVPFGMFLGPL